MKVILYTTHCPKCMVLEKKLKSKNIEYTENTDTDLMISKGFLSTPMLEVDGNIMDFKAANTWINER
ncbi:MAG: glutaredoxin family protein [Coprococcus eutactus]